MTLINGLCPWIFTVDTTTVMSYPHPISSDLQTLITSPCWNVALLPLGQMLLSLTQALMQWKCKQQWHVAFLWLCMGELWSCFLTPKFRVIHQVSPTSSQKGCTLLSMGACGSHHMWSRFLWIFVILPTLCRARHYQKITNFSCSGFRKRRRTDFLCWIPAGVSIHQPSPGLELSLWGSLGVP